MGADLIRAANHFTGKLKQPVKLKILATEATVYVDHMAVIGYILPL